MPNLRYNRGAKYEREIVNEAKARGCIAFRSAGSHSPIDVCIIDPTNCTIELIQCKLGRISKPQSERLYKEFGFLEKGMWKIIFRLENKIL